MKITCDPDIAPLTDREMRQLLSMDTSREIPLKVAADHGLPTNEQLYLIWTTDINNIPWFDVTTSNDKTVKSLPSLESFTALYEDIHRYFAALYKKAAAE